MMDFPIADLFDDSLCLLWLERHLHPNGFLSVQYVGAPSAAGFVSKATTTPIAAVSVRATRCCSAGPED
jgi:hypothetical protein